MNMSKQFLSLQEAAAFLDVSKAFLYQLTYRRKINFYKPSGKLVYFKLSDLENFISNGLVKSKETIENETNEKLIEGCWNE